MPERVLEMATFAGSLDGADAEDLLPTDLLVQQVDRWQRGPDEAFADFHQPGTPIVPQIETWAKKPRHHVGRRMEGTWRREQIGPRAISRPGPDFPCNTTTYDKLR
jgi:hypothetical protein